MTQATTPEPRRVARRLVGTCLRGEGFASHLLRRESRQMAPADAALLRELVLGTLRHLRRIDFILQSGARRPLTKMHPEVLDGLRVAVFQLLFLDRVPAHAAVNAAVQEARRSMGPNGARLANGILRSLLRQGTLDQLLPPPTPVAERLGVEFSLPAWWVERKLADFGPELLTETAAAMAAAPTIDLMVSPAARERMTEQLRKEGVEVETVVEVPTALRLPRSRRPPSRLLEQGEALVVDLGAQWVAGCVPAGGRVLDACAAPGGKAAAIGMRAQPSDRRVASDRSLSRIGLLNRNRGRFREIGDVVVADLLHTAFRRETFDAVLVDAPCSGSGTFGKNPEIRWRLEPGDLVRHRDEQSRLIEAAAALVVTGGRLVWSTCSLEPEENEQVVAGFLARHQGWHLDPLAVPQALASRVIDLDGGGNGVRLLPDGSSDGHSVFRLRRV